MIAARQHADSASRTARAEKIALQASKSFSKLDYKTASQLWKSAIEQLCTDKTQAELSTRLRLCLAESLTRQKDYSGAEREVAIIERLIEQEMFENSALNMRLLRRKVQLALHKHNAPKALHCQESLCEVVKSELGTLNRVYLNELFFLQWIQLQSGKLNDSYQTGQQLNSSLERFGLNKSIDQWELCWMRLGMALAGMNRLSEAETQLEKSYRLSVETNLQNAGLTAAWLATVAQARNDAQREKFWLEELDGTRSNRPAKELLAEAQNHLKSLKRDWLKVENGNAAATTSP